jgi:hypothetical protein
MACVQWPTSEYLHREYIQVVHWRRVAPGQETCLPRFHSPQRPRRGFRLRSAFHSSLAGRFPDACTHVLTKIDTHRRQTVVDTSKHALGMATSKVRRETFAARVFSSRGAHHSESRRCCLTNSVHVAAPSNLANAQSVTKGEQATARGTQEVHQCCFEASTTSGGPLQCTM